MIGVLDLDYTNVISELYYNYIYIKKEVSMIIKSRQIVLEDRVHDGFVVVEEGKITAVLPADKQVVADVDYGNQRVIPGIFDTHNHGTYGYGLRGVDSKENEEVVKGYLKGLASQGVTCIFPTAGLDTIATCARVATQTVDGAKIVGIHSEGPWLNRVGEKGIKTGWPEVSLTTAEKMLSDGAGLLRLVGIAPEIPGSDMIIDFFLKNGVTMAFTHSDYQYEDAKAAISKRLTVSTHQMNVMTGLHHRDIGGAGACLLDDDVYCELICDGLHVSLPMVQLILKIKDNDKIMMISDCSELSGAPIGRYRRPNTNMIVSVGADGFLLSDTGRLMGSSKPVIYGIKNMVNIIGLPIYDVCKMSSLNQAVKYGYKDRGSITVGKFADMVVIDDDYNPLYTYSEGRLVYDHKTDTELFNQSYLAEIRLD